MSDIYRPCLRWPYSDNDRSPGWFLRRMDDFHFWGIVSTATFPRLEDGTGHPAQGPAHWPQCIRDMWIPQSCRPNVHRMRTAWRRGPMFEIFAHCGAHYPTDSFKRAVAWEKARCKIGPYRPRHMREPFAQIVGF